MTQTKQNTIDGSRKQKKRSKVGPSHPLDSYLNEIARISVFSADKERALSAEIAAHRVEFWKALLSYPPFVGPMAELIVQLREAIDDFKELPDELLDEAKRASRAYRDRETRANLEAYEKSRCDLANAMAALDLDGLASGSVTADLDAIVANKRSDVRMKVTFPPKGSRPFARYLDRVQKASNG